MVQPRALVVNENEPVPFDTRVWQECLALRDAGWLVDVICPMGAETTDRDREERLAGVSIHRYPLRLAGGGPAGYLREYALALFHTMRLALRVGRVDVVHASNPPDFMFLVAWVLRWRGTRFVFDQHDLVPELYLSRFGRGRDIFYRLTCLLEWLSYRCADVVIATNDSYARTAAGRGRVPRDRIFTVRNAPAAHRLQPTPPDPALKNGRPYLLCYLGTMGPQDGVDYALRALASLRDDLGRHDWHAVFIGSGDQLGDLRRLARDLGLDDVVTFTGRISDQDLARHLSSADVCLAPDPVSPLNDVSSMTKVIEYMTMGRPVVAFDLHETRATAGEAAAYAPGNSERAFAEQITTLLDDPERRHRMGEIGRSRATGPLSWDTARASLLAAYDVAVGRSRSRTARPTAVDPSGDGARRPGVALLSIHRSRKLASRRGRGTSGADPGR